MGLTMIILPMSGLVTFEELMSFIREEELSPSKIITTMAKNMGNMSAFFTIYIMQVTFITNLVQLYDVPHLVTRLIGRYRAFLTERKHVDTYFFQIGYYQGFTMTMFMMCLLFSIMMPIVTAFALTFFYIRFYIEKYNILYVYQQEYENYGYTRDWLIPYMICVTILFQIFNFTFIHSTIDIGVSPMITICFVVLQVLFLALCYCAFKKYKRFRKFMQKYFFLKPKEMEYES